MRDTAFLELSEIQQQQRAAGKSYLEFLRVPEMSAGVYVIPAAGADPQKPHREAELYCVVRGRARMRAGGEDRMVSAGSVIFISAGVEHRFHDVEEDLTVLVLFAPAES